MNIRYYMKNPLEAGVQLLCRYGKNLSDEKYLKIMYFLRMRHRLNLKSPKTFSEKLQWLKLYDRRPEYTTMVDKYAVKDYVAGIIGKDYIIPTLGVWDNPDDIEWDKLPDQFVLKTTHGGGGKSVFVCKDKSTFDKEGVVQELKKSLNVDIYRMLKEWPYKNVVKRVIAEKYIEPRPDIKDLPDYKWYCFNGEPKYCQVIQNRSEKETIDFFDTEWNHQVFVGLNPAAGPAAGPAAVSPACPAHLETQIRIAKELSKGMPFSRIDLYELEEGTYFGEITFYPASGLGEFSPQDYNYILGKMLTLPGENRGGGDNQ